MGRTRDQARTDELLSAYLDGMLSPRERERLEARLAVDAELRARLESLRQTVALLRAMPRVPAPRNYLLRPAMVAAARPRSRASSLLAPALSFATAVSALLCVVVFVANVMGGLPGGMRAAAPLPAEAPPYPVAEAATPQQMAVPTEEETPSPAERGLPPAIPSPTPSVDMMMAAEAVTETPAAEMPLLGGGVVPTATLIAPAALPYLTATTTVTSPLVVAEGGEAEAPVVSERPARGWLCALFLPWLPAVGLSLLTVGLAAASFVAWRARRR
jgi:hypothetical protein